MRVQAGPGRTPWLPSSREAAGGGCPGPGRWWVWPYGCAACQNRGVIRHRILPLSLALAVCLGGCSDVARDPAPPDPANPSVPADPAGQPDSSDGPGGGTPSAVPGGAASAGAASDGSAPDVQALKTRLESLAASDPAPDRNGITQAFVAAGFSASSVEVSADRTPTGLDVDSIQGAALQDGQCLFGEVRDGRVTVSVLPVLSDGRCFVGN